MNQFSSQNTIRSDNLPCLVSLAFHTSVKVKISTNPTFTCEKLTTSNLASSLKCN